jgi:NTP pyrophosphatase (non-canonical NTP hydrolase)
VLKRSSTKPDAGHCTFLKLYKIVEGLNKRFPGGDDPFRILSRLMEETGELAQEVHHFEGLKGHRRQDPPDKDHLAKECLDIFTAVLHLAQHYRIENELSARIDEHYRMVISEGLAEPLE